MATSSTPPRCLQCKLMPVTPARGSLSKDRLAKLQIVNGVPWRMFCSRACAGRYMVARQSPESRRRQAMRLVAVNAEKRHAWLRQIAGVASAVPLGVELREIIKSAYTRGYHAGWSRGYVAGQHKRRPLA